MDTDYSNKNITELKDLKRQFKVTKESYLDESLGKASPSTRRIDKEIKKIDSEIANKKKKNSKKTKKKSK